MESKTEHDRFLTWLGQLDSGDATAINGGPTPFGFIYMAGNVQGFFSKDGSFSGATRKGADGILTQIKMVADGKPITYETFLNIFLAKVRGQ